MDKVKTPCIGICSTTSLGDKVCRGCKRYAFEVIRWNAYDGEAKEAVMKRIEKLQCQILENKFRIFSVDRLRRGLEGARTPYDPDRSPYCWLHNLLNKQHQSIDDLSQYGVEVLGEFADMPLATLCDAIDRDILLLSDAHFDRYLSGRTLESPV